MQHLGPFLVNDYVQIGKLIAVNGDSQNGDTEVLSLQDRVVASVRYEQFSVVVGQDIRLGPPERTIAM